MSDESSLAKEQRPNSGRTKRELDPEQSFGPAKSRRSASRLLEHQRVMGIEPTFATKLRSPDQSLTDDDDLECD